MVGHHFCNKPVLEVMWGYRQFHITLEVYLLLLNSNCILCNWGIASDNVVCTFCAILSTEANDSTNYQLADESMTDLSLSVNTLNTVAKFVSSSIYTWTQIHWLIGPWEILMTFLMSNFHGTFSHWWLMHLLWNCHQMNVTGPCQW